MRLGFNSQFPDYVEPPSAETMIYDFVLAGFDRGGSKNRADRH